MLETLTDASFSPHVGTSCRLLTAPGVPPIELEIAAVEVVGQGMAGRRAPFSVLFRGPAARPLPQGIYRVEHERLGALDIFIVPIGPDGGGMGYEAIFN
jgi:hypothetical protein